MIVGMKKTPMDRHFQGCATASQLVSPGGDERRSALPSRPGINCLQRKAEIFLRGPFTTRGEEREFAPCSAVLMVKFPPK